METKETVLYESKTKKKIGVQGIFGITKEKLHKHFMDTNKRTHDSQ